jgi:hypothetical protein
MPRLTAQVAALLTWINIRGGTDAPPRRRDRPVYPAAPRIGN